MIQTHMVSYTTTGLTLISDMQKVAMNSSHCGIVKYDKSGAQTAPPCIRGRGGLFRLEMYHSLDFFFITPCLWPEKLNIFSFSKLLLSFVLLVS